jgi:hypothetical protein
MLFAVTTYKDTALAEVLITSLQYFYPDATILVLDDARERLKLPQYSGQWTERFLRAFLLTAEEVCIKIDPDTHVNFRAAIPRVPIFSAYRYNIHGERILAGPAIGFSRATAIDLVLSGLLRDPVYSTKFYYPRFYPPFLKPGEEQSFEMVSCQDEIVTDIVRRLGIPTEEWAAVSLSDSTAPFYHSP